MTNKVLFKKFSKEYNLHIKYGYNKMRSEINSFARKIYGFAFFNEMTLMTPVYAVFMQSRGVSDGALSFLLMLYPIGILMSQFVVTWLTIRMGQRLGIIVGQLIKAVAFSMIWLIPYWWGFAIAMLIWGIQGAFSAVAFEGLIYDELSARGAVRTYTRVLGRKNAAAAIGTAVSAFGSLAMLWGYGWITAASVVALLISVLCVANIRVMAPDNSSLPTRPRFLSVVSMALRACRGNVCMVGLMLICLLVANFAYLDDYLGPIGVSLGLSVEYVGIISFLLMGCSILGQTFAYRFAGTRPRVIYSVICVGGILFMLFGHIYSLAWIGLLAAAYLLFGGLNVLLYSDFQNAISPRYRSLMLSFYSIVGNVAYVLAYTVIGIGGSMGSWRYSVMFLGTLLVLVGCFGIWGIRNRCAAIPTSPESAPAA